MEDNKFKIIHSTICGAITAVIFIIAITIAADIYLSLKDLLKSVFSHHWIGKSILSVAVFIIVGAISFLLPIQANEEKISRLLRALSFLLIIGILAIFSFFVYETIR